MCNILKVSRSSFYKFLNKKESKRSIENKELKSEIVKIYEDSKKRYGAPKIHKALKTKNIYISVKRVQKIMKKLDIKAIVCKEFRPFTSKAKVQDRESWCYLASVMDLHSKKIIEYSIDKNMDTELAIAAVKNAYEMQKPSKSLILHSDLGSQYTSKEFSKYVLGLKIMHSFSAKGFPYIMHV